jgi:hypothetical protein
MGERKESALYFAISSQFSAFYIFFFRVKFCVLPPWLTIMVVVVVVVVVTTTTTTTTTIPRNFYGLCIELETRKTHVK